MDHTRVCLPVDSKQHRATHLLQIAFMNQAASRLSNLTIIAIQLDYFLVPFAKPKSTLVLQHIYCNSFLRIVFQSDVYFFVVCFRSR